MAVLILINSADPDEMQHYAAFHLGLHCLLKYPFRGSQLRFPVYKGLIKRGAKRVGTKMETCHSRLS